MLDAKEYHSQLHTKILAAMSIADWIYHDVRLNCDGEAEERTVERLRLVIEQHGTDALFGIAGAWALKAYWRLESAYKRVGSTEKPSLVPQFTEPVAEDESQSETFKQQRRTTISAMQFMGAISTDDLEMAEAIFKAAASEDIAEAVAIMKVVLIISLKLSDNAVQIR